MENDYSHLLVAIGFFDSDVPVFERAAQLAEQKKAKLTLLHVVEYMPVASLDELPALDSVEINKALEQRALKKLCALRDQLPSLEVGVQVRTGVPKRQIMEVAEENAVDLIVVGSHGRYGIQALLGSTADGVLHLAKCDVLAVRVK